MTSKDPDREPVRFLVFPAFVISSPEYNASMPGGLKNSLDWVSRFSPQPFNEKHCPLLSASPSMVGGNRGLWALRMPLEHLGVRVYPDMFSLAQAHQAFGEDRRIVTLSCRNASRRRSSASWTWSRPPSTTRARRRAGWSTWASIPTR
jgi:NAD(P)H-dependent FMN reductase